MERIYSEHGEMMMAVARRHLRDPADAEDVVQDAAVLLLRQRNAATNERGSAYTMADRASHHQLQRLRYRQHEALDLDNPLHHGPAPSAERVALARLTLAEIEREAPREVRLLGQGYSTPEIARMTGQDYRALWARLDKWRRDQAERSLEYS